MLFGRNHVLQHQTTVPKEQLEAAQTGVPQRFVLDCSQESQRIEVSAGQAIVVHRGEWVQYSTPGPEGAEYVAICLPAFSPDTVHRDES